MTGALSVRLCVLTLVAVGTLRGALCQPAVHPDLQAYARAAGVVDLSHEELLQAYPDEMADLEFDPSQEPLVPVLARLSANIKAFFADFPNTACRETVRQELLKPGGVAAHSEREYQYLVFLKSADVADNWEEDRTDAKGRPVRPAGSADLPFLTSGYAMASAYFHPGHRYGSRFRCLGRRRSASREYVIAFAQVPAMGDLLGTFTARVKAGTTPFTTTKSISTMFQGIAWVMPETFQIVRLRTDLLAPRPEIGLERQTTVISYAEVEFPNIAQRFWLPKEVVVTLQWQRRTYRNTHRYADYRVFTVQSFDKLDRVGGAGRTPH